MGLDWNARFRLEDRHVVFHGRTCDRTPRVTIGMPTFNRAHTIRRALSSVARQTFRDFVLVISDNAGESQATIDAVREFSGELPEVYLVAQNTNIGALANLHFLLACAETEYFMWLADDDEISCNYLEKLVALLDSDQIAVSAMGRWRMMRNSGGEERPQLENASQSRAVRVFRHIAFQSEDSLFYGLHRTDRMRRCHFSGYFYPNRGVLTNWCYLFLFDLLWQGPVHHTRDATWICHSDDQKSYAMASPGGVLNKLKTLVRRVNVYLLYCAKTASRNPLLLSVSVPASLIGLARDIFFALARVASRHP